MITLWRVKLIGDNLRCEMVFGVKGVVVKTKDAWAGIVEKKNRAAFDGANLYRQVTVRFDEGSTSKVRVPRELWKALEVGDRVVKEAGADPRRG